MINTKRGNFYLCCVRVYKLNIKLYAIYLFRVPACRVVYLMENTKSTPKLGRVLSCSCIYVSCTQNANTNNKFLCLFRIVF